MQALLGVISSHSGNVQSYALLALREALQYQSAMDTIHEHPSTVSQLYALITTETTSTPQPNA